MLTPFHLITAFSVTSILFVAETTFSLPLTASSQYPVVPRSGSDRLVCYMQTADGKTLNLDSICKSQLNAQSQIAISNVRNNDGHLVGRVVNRTDKTVYSAKVNFEVLGKDGRVVERGATYVEPQTLSPGETATFQTFMPGGNVRAASVEWDE